jgi:8-oxo-dGTP diphosphatase
VVSGILSLVQEDLRYPRELLQKFDDLPRFADGRINFSGSNKAPVVTCFVEFDGRILLLRRSEKVRTYPGKWCTVTGYLDEPKTVRQKALTELEEELKIAEYATLDYRSGTPYEFEDPGSGKIWIVHPVRVRLAEPPRIVLDWEHTDFQWIAPETIGKYETVPMLERSLKTVMGSGQ